MTTAWGALFDWDGVVVDSREQHERSWERLAAAEGRTLPPDHFRRGFGMKNTTIIPTILGWSDDPEEVARLSARKEAVYRELVEEAGIRPLPGVRPFLAALAAAGVPSCIGTSTSRQNLDTAVAAMGLEGAFADAVTAEDVHHGKPHPEVFEVAAARLGLPASRCVVFEDAHVGIEAARAAGARVVAVASTHARETLTDADRVVDRLDELDVAELTGWFVQ